MMRAFKTPAIAIILAAFVLPCASEEAAQSPTLKPWDVLATYKLDDKTVPVTVTDYRAEMLRGPSPGPTGRDPGYVGAYMTMDVQATVIRIIVDKLARQKNLHLDAEFQEKMKAHREQLLVGLLNDTVVGTARKVSDQDVAKYYEEHKSDYSVKESAKIICVHSFCLSATDAPKMEAAKKRCEEALEKIKAGEDFAAVAKSYTDSPGKNKGEPVTVDPAETNPKIQEAVKKLAPGEISGVLELPHGYTIVKLLEYSPARTKALGEVAKEIRRRIDSDTRKKHVSDTHEFHLKELSPRKYYDRFEGGNDDTVLFEFADVKFTRGDFMKTMRDQEIREKALESKEFRDRGLDQALDRQVNVHVAQSRGLDKTQTFKSQMEVFEKNLLYRSLTDQMVKEATEKIEITEEDLRNAYEKYKQYLTTPKEIKVQMLVIDVPTQNGPEEEPSRKEQAEVYWRAAKLIDRVKSGEDFGAIIREHSPEQGDGISEFKSIRQFDRELVPIVGRLSAGEMSDPTLSSDGRKFTIVKMLEVREPGQLGFEEAKEKIRPYALSQKTDDLKKQLLDLFPERYAITLDEKNVSRLPGSVVPRLLEQETGKQDVPGKEGTTPAPGPQTNEKTKP